jgi:hypothetical protein
MSYLLALFLLAADPADQRSALEKDPTGWVDMLPGRGLKGWTRIAPVSSRGVKSKVVPELEVWSVDRKTRLLDCRGHLPAAPSDGSKPGSHEMLRHDKELGDFIFHVEWRFKDDKRPGWNSGVFVRARADGTVWHQAQVGNAAGGNWSADTPDATGKVTRVTADARDQRVKPAGEWNVYEVTARGDTLTSWVNGAVVSELRGVRVLRGHVGLEAEYHHVEFRNLKLKELR